jgi:anti-anti-sigma factor
LAVVLDLVDVGFVDSTGLGALLSVRERAARFDIEFKIGRASASVERILDLTGTRSVLGG